VLALARVTGEVGAGAALADGQDHHYRCPLVEPLAQ
jgi:hypothetical protein